MARRKGTTGDDVLTGRGADDVLIGLAGNDTLTGGFGDDRLEPGTGIDHLFGSAGDDRAIVVELDAATPDTFDGGQGFDTVDLSRIARDTSGFFFSWSYDSQTDLYTVERPNTPIDAAAALSFTNVEAVIGTRNDDLIVFASSSDSMTIDAGAGDDWVRAGSGRQTVHGGTGDDQIDFGWGRVAFFGDDGNDEIDVGVAQSGAADGGDGFDTISGSGDVNLLRGYATGSGGSRIALSGFERISMVGAADGSVATGDNRNNLLTGDGWPSNYVFYGMGGKDTIIGADGDDRMSGGKGDDLLDGGLGDDLLTGGQGADRFRISDDLFSSPTGTDTITDYRHFQGDRIDLSLVDANPSTFDPDPLHYIGTAAFGARSGEVRWEVRGGDAFVQVDVNGDSAADFEVRVIGTTTLRQSDFLFSDTAIALSGDAPHHPADGPMG